MELPFKIYIFFYKPFASTKQKHLLNSNVWNKFQILKIYRSYGTSFQNLHFSYKPFASPKQKHLLNSNVWNKFQILKIYRSYGTSFQILHFCYKPFASTKQFLKINIDFLKKQPQQYSNSPTLPFSNSPILKLSHSQALPLKINALPTNFYQRQLPPKVELVFPRQIPFRFL